MVNSEVIKTAVLSYYRFKRQMLCVDEAWCGIGSQISDVLVQSEKGFYDIEIKVSKSDLWHGEAKKSKHSRFKWGENLKHGPNYFVLCVPESLLSEAESWIREVNPNYGLIIFLEERYNEIITWMNPQVEKAIWVRKSPKRLHNNISNRLSEILIRRLCSAYINRRQKDLTK